MKAGKIEKSPVPAWRGVLLDGWRPYAWLAGLILVLYAHCVTYGMILLDDNVFLGDRFPILSDGGALPLVFHRGAFLTGGAGELYYRPLMIMSFMLDAHLGGRNPDIFHLSNIVFHIVSSALVFRVLRMILGEDRALLLAAVFAVHPALASAVAWINGRTDSFLAMFVLASFHCYQLFVRDGRRRWIVGHLAFWWAALFSKELAVVLPAACLGYAWAQGKTPRALRDHAGILLGWAAGLAAWFLARRAVLVPLPGQTYSMTGMLRSSLANLPAAMVYWGKIFVPWGLSPYPVLRDSSAAFGTVSALAVAFACILSRGIDWKKAFWGFCWFAIFLGPSFVYPDSAITPVFFEYRLYLPILGALVMLGAAAPIRNFDLGRASHALAGASLIIALGVAASANAEAYRDDLSAWSRAVAASPHSAFAHQQLGIALYMRKDRSGAEAQDRMALAIEPRKNLVHNNLGVIYLNTNRLGEAEQEFLLELQLVPDEDNALYNLGLVYASEGRLAQAAALWKRTLAVNPNYEDAREKLAQLSASRSR